MKKVIDEYSLLKATGIFCDSLPKSLVSPTQLSLLKKAADFFPPLLRFGLECRLTNDEQVDLQLCIRRDEDDLPAIHNWFQNKFTENQEQEKILLFLKTWADKSSSYYRNIAEVFLELDVLPSGIEAPLLFFQLQPGISATQKKNFCFSLLSEILGERQSFLSLFEKVLYACPDPAFIAYLGIMFSRDMEVLRINIKKLPFTAVAPFLRKLDYAWTGPALDQWISFIYSHADRVTLCIDIGENVLPKIGFECSWNEQPPKETYWRFFIEKLNSSGLYSKEKIEDILNWDKEIFPGEMEDWPEHLWIESLRKPENEFTILKKEISHLKLSYCPDKEIELKAYLGYGNLWKSKINSLNEKPSALISPLTVNQAINNGVDYLLSNQQQSGWWKDFYTYPGESDEWVTAYIAYHLARIKSPKTSEALHKAWEILQTRYRKNEGWGYNVLMQADADSTIWTWLFANTAGFACEFPEPGIDIMNKYSTQDGGIITYTPDGPIGQDSRNRDAACFHGWQIPHLCVTAACALAGRQRAIEYLLDHQNTAGYWYSYWWDGPEYATALSVEALYTNDAHKYEKAIELSVNWACESARKELDRLVPNDFKIAFLLRIILCSHNKTKHQILINATLNYLINTQQPSGYWNSSAELRIPKFDDTNHEKGENVFINKDHKRNFTTITILDALIKYDEFNVS
ncbi:hypothetical protein CLV59_108194 [Chitinophaga dinghuensis]|uniref:Squalene cyclase C-terminal domain-containing protein n=1 Tax=Chitinophaga dinghuensis TaxID=1539050 RepID=A0A327VQF8_9BACT|nr:hypothetical protein [Chitinophaga dinghuensis]RAJ76674.1 hypothetical protein CLV59_108194 [Chitinophaga dinghuensis]